MYKRCAQDKNKKTLMENPVVTNIMTRTSIREYLSEPVEKEKIEVILRAGMAAPSAINQQPWHFVVITDKEILESIAQYKSPLAIVVCVDMSRTLTGTAREFWINDLSAASENMLLAAHSLGLGSVWTAVYPFQVIMDKIRITLKLPDKLVPMNTLIFGYAAENPLPKVKWKSENISYNVYGNKK
jgi:nitroreductase